MCRIHYIPTGIIATLKHCKYKLDMGKSCVRFKKMDDIPYYLIAELATKMTAEEWIDIYEKAIKKN